MCSSPSEGLLVGLSKWQGWWEVQVAWFRKRKAADASPRGVKEQLQAGENPMTAGLPEAGVHKERPTGCHSIPGLWRSNSELASLRFPSGSWNRVPPLLFLPSIVGCLGPENHFRHGSLFSLRLLMPRSHHFPGPLTSSLSSPLLQAWIGNGTTDRQPGNRASALWTHFLAFEILGSLKSSLTLPLNGALLFRWGNWDEERSNKQLPTQALSSLSQSTCCTLGSGLQR